VSFLISRRFDASRFTACTRTLFPTVDYNYAGYTIVTKFMPTFLQSSGTGVRLTLHGPVNAGSAVTVSKVTISPAATASTSDLYDSSTTPTNVTFRSSDSVSLARNGYALSDEITFTIDRSRAILIAYNVSSSGGGMVPIRTGINTSYASSFFRAATAEAGTTNRTTGYSASAGVSAFLFQLETFT
jgi:hypothetical protein